MKKEKEKLKASKVFSTKRVNELYKLELEDKAMKDRVNENVSELVNKNE